MKQERKTRKLHVERRNEETKTWTPIEFLVCKELAASS
jgi:hypothetical protein